MRAVFLATLLSAALFAIPAPASQPQDAGLDALTPQARLASMQKVMGFMLDPHAAQPFQIHLPDHIGEVTGDAGLMSLAFVPLG